jgi:histidinol-phosphatase (PHP family)
MIPQDYHIHSNYSCDCQVTMEEMCQAAIEFGVEEIGFSDHYDLIPEDPCCAFFQADAWWQTLQRCREDFRGSLSIRAGIELGEPHLFQTEIQEILGSYPWDYSLASVHWVGSKTVFDSSYFTNTPDVAYRTYFREVAEMVTRADFDILAHMDVVKRYGFDIYGVYDPLQFESEIREILSICAKRGIALEVNTAYLRRPIQQISPSPVILSWFREEGGQRVTLGSDAHLSEHVGFGLDSAMGFLRSAGFKHLTSFESRNPSTIPILRDDINR